MIDLIPNEYYEQQRIDPQKLKMIIIAVIAISLGIIVILNSVQLYYKSQTLDNKIEQAKAELEQLEAETQKIVELKEEMNELEEIITRRENLIGNRVDWAPVLYELEKIVPEASWLGEYQLTDDEFKLTGYTLERENLRQFVEQLKASDYFVHTDFDLLRKENIYEPGHQSAEVIEYNLEGKVVLEEE